MSDVMSCISGGGAFNCANEGCIHNCTFVGGDAGECVVINNEGVITSMRCGICTLSAATSVVSHHIPAGSVGDKLPERFVTETAYLSNYTDMSELNDLVATAAFLLSILQVPLFGVPLLN